MLCQQRTICMATDLANTCAGDFELHCFLFVSHSDKRTHHTGFHASHVRCCGWLQPRLEILPDILFTNQAQYNQYVTDNSNSHAGAHVNTHEVAQYYLQHQVQLRPTRGI